MGRTDRSNNLSSWTRRKDLDPGRDYMETLAQGKYLSYRRPKNGRAGTWTARGCHPITKKILRTGIGTADDLAPMDEGTVPLTHDQAVTKAGEWFGQVFRVQKVGQVVPDQLRTVRDVIAYYIAAAKQTRKNIKTAFDDEKAAAANILPELGDIMVEALTADTIEAWRNKLAGRGRRKTGWTRKEGEEVEHLPFVPEKRAKTMTKAQLAEATELAVKRRKSSTNRDLALLKSALNMAVDKGKITKDHTPWMVVGPYRGVKGKRVRFLSVAEQVRLVNACPQDFRQLVRGALYTGARYGDLTSALVMDFDASNGSLRFDRKGADTNIGHVYLTEEGTSFFKELVAGRPGSELLFIRHDVKRGSRQDMKNADGWLKNDVKTPMERACKDAQIEPLCFYELRHTYASGLIARGVALMIVAQQLGHTDTRMVEKHYGHLAPNATRATILALAPTLGINEPARVQELATNQA